MEITEEQDWEQGLGLTAADAEPTWTLCQIIKLAAGLTLF